MSKAGESEAMAASRIEHIDHRIMSQPNAMRAFSLRRSVLRMRLNTTRAKNTGSTTLIRPRAPDANACRARPNTPCTRNHSEAQKSTARITMTKQAMSRRYAVRIPVVEDRSGSMTLVSPERALPGEPLPPVCPLEDAVRAITVLILPIGTPMSCRRSRFEHNL